MQTGNIYKIIHTQSNICYIGSTFDSLRNRFRKHKTNSNCGCNTSLTPYIQEYGIENFKIILIKQYEVCDKKHLQAYEQLWINKLNSINIMQTFKPLKKQFEKIRLSLIDSKEYKKQYHKDHKVESNQRSRDRYQKNKEKLSEKINCECGGKYTNQHKLRHMRSEKHLISIGEYIKIVKDPTDKILCECGIQYSRSNKDKHLKSKKHLNFTK